MLQLWQINIAIIMAVCTTKIGMPTFTEYVPLKMVSVQPRKWQGSKFHSSDRLRRVKMSRTSGIAAGLVQPMIAYFWFSHKLHWLCIFQTSEYMYYIWTSDFTMHLPDGQVHLIWNFEAWSRFSPCCYKWVLVAFISFKVTSLTMDQLPYARCPVKLPWSI